VVRVRRPVDRDGAVAAALRRAAGLRLRAAGLPAAGLGVVFVVSSAM
jgi:hypothetical protein